jgi:hypothetical protein
MKSAAAGAELFCLKQVETMRSELHAMAAPLFICALRPSRKRLPIHPFVVIGSANRCQR